MTEADIEQSRDVWKITAENLASQLSDARERIVKLEEIIAYDAVIEALLRQQVEILRATPATCHE